MSALVLVALLGLTVSLPLFMDSDDPETPDDPDTPLEPETLDDAEAAVEPDQGIEEPDAIVTVSDQPVDGTQGNDVIIANEDGDGSTVNGADGEDSITVTGSDVVANGGSGDDNLIAAGTNVTLDGGDGDDRIASQTNVSERTDETQQDELSGSSGIDTFDVNLAFPDAPVASGRIDIATITDFDPETEQLNITSGNNDASGVAFDGLSLSVAEDGSYTDVIATYNSLTDGVAPTEAIIRLVGVQDLSLGDISLSTGDTTSAGEDYISSGGGLSGAVATITGGAGDDLLMHEGRDDAGPLIMQGEEGNDTLIASEIEFANATTLDGGAGDDLLRTEIFETPAPSSIDTFITGAGSDVVEISVLTAGPSETSSIGLVANVQDFTPGEDLILIDPGALGTGALDTFTLSVALQENTAEAFTDVDYVVTSVGNGGSITGSVRLEGLTGITEGDIGVGISERTESDDRPEYLYTETSERQA